MEQFPALEFRKRFLSDNQCRFLLANKDLKLLFFPGVEIIVYEKETGRLAVGMVIDEQARDPTKKQGLKELTKWQKRLTKWQGPLNPDFLRHDVIKECYRCHHEENNKAPYIAKDMNHLLSELISGYLAFLRRLDQVKGEFSYLTDFLSWYNDNSYDILTYDGKQEYLGELRFNMINASNLLHDFLNDDDKTAELIAYAVQEMKAGYRFFLDDYPITEQHIYNTFERYETWVNKYPEKPLMYTDQTPIPPIFDVWHDAMKIQWGRAEDIEFDYSVESKPFIYESFTDPFSMLSSGNAT